METEATIGYGFIVDPEGIKSAAVLDAALKLDSIKNNPSRYIDTYDGKMSAKYPSEMLREVALAHPDFDGFLSVSRTGDQSGENDDAMLLITARSTTQTAYVCGRIPSPVEPTEQELQALLTFKERYFVPMEDEDKAYWVLGSSCD